MAPANLTSSEEIPFDTGENFADLLDEAMGENGAFEGSVVKGTVIAVDDDAATIDVGLKSEGRVDLKEFADPGQPAEIKVGFVNLNWISSGPGRRIARSKFRWSQKSPGPSASTPKIKSINRGMSTKPRSVSPSWPGARSQYR